MTADSPVPPPEAPLTARTTLIEAMIGLDAWSDDAERDEWLALIDATVSEALDRDRAARTAAEVLLASDALRGRVEAVLAAWEVEPVWTRNDVIAGIRAALAEPRPAGGEERT